MSRSNCLLPWAIIGYEAVVDICYIVELLYINVNFRVYCIVLHNTRARIFH